MYEMDYMLLIGDTVGLPSCGECFSSGKSGLCRGNARLMQPAVVGVGRCDTTRRYHDYCRWSGGLGESLD